MARDAKILRVFVASPNDVADERSAVDGVVSEINNTQFQYTGAFLQVIKWETHAFPGLGSDGQQVINEEIDDDYDIFVGILSTRFGTPTKRAESGTAEEFERAYKRYQKDPLLIRVMFYFKDPQIRASELDLNQYGLVKDFQKRLGDEGLYWTFNSAEDFTTYLRMHLTRQLQAWAQGKWGMSGPTEVQSVEARPLQPIPGNLQVEDDSDVGYLDLVESGQENLGTTNDTLKRMVDALNELNEKLQENTPRLTEAAERRDLKRAKYIVNHIAEVMEQYAGRMDTELPIFSQSFSWGIDAVSRSATIWWSDFKSEDTGTMIKMHSQIENLLLQIGAAREQMLALEASVSRVPRLTKKLNRAKAHTQDALSSFTGELATAHNLTLETEKELRRLLES